MTSCERKRRLPIGVQSFREIREECGYYVDKTGFALQLVREGKHYFLSRPRRFGKSLFVDMLKELFEGNRELFEGLAVEPQWDWSERRPVVRLDFSGVNANVEGDLDVDTSEQLRDMENEAGVAPLDASVRGRFRHLIRSLHRRTGRRVAVLVDEYDKPILDALRQPETARANRDYLRGLYSVIKSCDAHVRFCFLTGVSKFSKVNLFSGLNNLKDITLDRRFSSICGYTEGDLDAVFSDRLEGLDRERVREWYSGYSWGGKERVYNPFDMLLLLDTHEYSNWWFETGTPTFLIDFLLEKRVPWHRLDGMVASGQLLSKFDVGDIAPEALMFQAGYLTVLERLEVGGRPRYRLGYPNREVRESLNADLLNSVLGAGWQREHQADRLCEALEAGDLAALEDLLRALLAGIPHRWHGKNPMGTHEGWYASVLYAHFAALGVEVRAEESGSRGRADLVVRGYGRVWVFEFKMRERAGPGAALDQLMARGYADRYRGLGEPVHVVGVEFSAETRNLIRFESQIG